MALKAASERQFALYIGELVTQDFVKTGHRMRHRFGDAQAPLQVRD